MVYIISHIQKFSNLSPLFILEQRKRFLFSGNRIRLEADIILNLVVCSYYNCRYYFRYYIAHI